MVQNRPKALLKLESDLLDVQNASQVSIFENTVKLLLTNDDGFDAPGLRALLASVTQNIRILANLSNDLEPLKITVVAPDRGRSECSHSITTGRDLKIAKVSVPTDAMREEGHSLEGIDQFDIDWYAVNGTPVDCVRVALFTVASDATAVMSGINAGANVGIDCFGSGTFAAAREASHLGRHSIAISHYRKPNVPKTWCHASDWLAGVYRQYIERLETWTTRPPQMSHPGLRRGLFWNVNLPALKSVSAQPEIVFGPFDKHTADRQAELVSLPKPHDAHNDTKNLPVQNDFSVAKITEFDNDLSDEALRHATQIQGVQMTSEFHQRPRSVGSDIEICFGGRISVTEC